MRRDLVIGLIVSLLVHGGVAWIGELTAHGPVKAKPKEESNTVQLIEMPRIEPDEPDVVDPNQQQLPTNFAPPVQNDVPSLNPDSTFVQQLEPPPPDTSQMNKGTIVIPEGTGTWGKGMEVFDISKLDQIPVATVQVRPQYPFEMRRAGISGQVVVDFIVDTSGLVHNAYAASSTQRDFESSAVQAVSKWRFRPGRKGGRAVNTHMQVPIVFTLNAED
jgi:protein TonB